MKALWVYPGSVNELVLVEDTIVITIENAVVALDHQGHERWRRLFVRRPRSLTRCGRGVAFELAEHASATQVVALDVNGNEMWRYGRDWELRFPAITGDDHGIALHGEDHGQVPGDRWVGLDATTGACLFDMRPPTTGWPMVAGPWLIAHIDDGEHGVLRMDREARNPTTLTTLSYTADGANDELVLLNTSSESGRCEVVAIELSSGLERWRAPGGEQNIYLELHGSRAAWIEGSANDGKPVVHDLATGARIWSGDRLPRARYSYHCKLGPDALVCFSEPERVVYYSLAASSPIHTREWNGDRPGVNRFSRDRFLENARNGLTCWEELDRAPITPSLVHPEQRQPQGEPRPAQEIPRRGLHRLGAPGPAVTYDDGYLVAVAHSLVFALSDEWNRLSAHDPEVSRERARAAIGELRGLGIEVSFGDGEQPVVPDAGASAVAVLRDQLQRIRAIAPQVFVRGADTHRLILCTDPWPRIYTLGVLDVPATSPVHVIQESDMFSRLDEWWRMGKLSHFRELRMIFAFGSPLDRMLWPVELSAFPELRALDLSGSWMSTLPVSVANATALEWLELSYNPLDAAAIAPLAALPRLRYVGLRGTQVRATDLDALRLPDGCEVGLEDP